MKILNYKTQVIGGMMAFFYAITAPLIAQVLDPTFVSPQLYRAAEVWSMDVDPSGKIYFQGPIDYFGNLKVNKVVRMTPYGQLDKTFKPALPVDFAAYEVKSMPNGNVLVRNDLTVYLLSKTGKLVKRITLNATIGGMFPMPDNSFFVSTWSGELFRYTKTGKVDKKFKDTAGFVDGAITAMGLQGSKIVIGGWFNNVRGIENHNIARISMDGTVDLTFKNGSGTSDFIGGIMIQPDNKIVPFGTFINEYDGQYFHGGLRLNEDGSVDSTFTYPFQFSGPRQVAYTNGKLLFTLFDGIFRTNQDGSIDESFQPIQGEMFHSLKTQVLADMSVVVAGYPPSMYGISKFDRFGLQVESFEPKLASRGSVNTAKQLGNELVIGGEFFKVNDLLTRNVARLNLQGSVDPQFHVEDDYGPTFQIDILPDRSVLISEAGNFFKVDAFGRRDHAFNFQYFDKLYQVEHFHVLENGRIYAAGPNNNYRLNADGTWDTTYHVGDGIGGWVSTLYGYDVDKQNRPLYGSIFDSYQGESVGKMLRINDDGSRDTTFNIGTGADNQVGGIHVLKNGDILVIGYFTNFNGTAIPNKAVVLSPDGDVRPDFLANFVDNLRPFWYQAFPFRDKILLTSYGSSVIIDVYNLDGTLATDFVISPAITGFKPWPKFYSPDESVLYIMGEMQLSSGETRSSIVRTLYPTEQLQTSSASAFVTNLEVQKDTPQMTVYPNPVSEVIHIDVSDSGSYIIYDLSGEKRMRGNLAQGQNDLRTSDLKAGTYILAISVNGKTYRTRISKN